MTADAHSETMPSEPGRCRNCGGDVPESSLNCAACGAPQRRSQSRAPGAILGAYRLIQVLGEGGMGVVYLAEHMRLGRRVAIKTLRSEYASNPQAVQRFFAEARAVNTICHPNIVEITDFVQEAGGDNYYIMELLQGQTLAKIVDRTKLGSVERAVAIAIQVVSALDAVHAAGIIHRDLKSDNVFLIERGGQQDFVKLLDFGVAKLNDSASDNEAVSVHRTAAGAILGTPEYMSPEQASGKAVDVKTDVYSFGVMLYELVTGRLPFRADSFGELVVKHLTVSPVAPRRIKGLGYEIPPALDDLILACLAKSPIDRPSIAAVGQRLTAIVEQQGWALASFKDSPRPSRSMAALGRLAPQQPRNWRRIALPGGGAVVLASVIALWATRGGAERKPAPVVTPTPAPAPPIELDFTSTPSGAHVIRIGDDADLGATPTSLTVAAVHGTIVFEFRADGYQPLRQPVKTDRSAMVSVALVPVAPAQPIVVAPPPVTPPATAAGDRKPKKPRTGKRGAGAPAVGAGSAAGKGDDYDRNGVIDPLAEP